MRPRFGTDLKSLGPDLDGEGHQGSGQWPQRYGGRPGVPVVGGQSPVLAVPRGAGPPVRVRPSRMVEVICRSRWYRHFDGTPGGLCSRMAGDWRRGLFRRARLRRVVPRGSSRMAGDGRWGAILRWSPAAVMVDRSGLGHRQPPVWARRAWMQAIDSASDGRTSGCCTAGTSEPPQAGQLSCW